MSTSKKTRNPGSRKTASSAKPAAKAPIEDDFAIGGVQAPKGKITRIELPIARLVSGTTLTLPIAIVRGASPGPTVWASGAIHGDELNGIPIIRRVIRQLDPTQMAGTLIAAPIVNVFGLLGESRYLPDRRDLNRSFPGSKRGSLTSQLAHLFMTEVVLKCKLGIDLHTGSGGRTNIPQIRCSNDPETVRLARAFGAPVIFHSPPTSGTLRGACKNNGIRVLLYEAGEALRFDNESIDVGVDGILRVMNTLEMIETPDLPPARKAITVGRGGWVRASRSGFCRVLVSLGDEVKDGHEVATVFDSIGEVSTRVKSNSDGIVVGVLRTPLVHRGDAIVHVAPEMD